MNNKDFISNLAERTGYTMADTQRMVDTVIGAMSRQFENGDVVQIPQFGSFEVKTRKERVIVNPTTGQRMLVPPKVVLGFKPTTSIKEQIKKGGDA